VRLDFFKTGSAPLLLGHDRDQQIGVIESASIGSDRKGRAKVRFGRSALADEILTDVRDKIRRNVSVGYRLDEVVLESEKDGVPTYRVKSWTPMEVSIVPIPADQTVGVGRNNAPPAPPAQPQPAPPAAQQKEAEIMNPPTPAADGQRNQPPAQIPAQIAAQLPAGDLNALRQAERDRMAEITATGQRFNRQKEAEKAVLDGTSVADFRKWVLDNMQAPAPVAMRRPEDPEIGLSDREVGQFSFLRAIRALVDPTDRGLREAAAFEFECSAAARKKLAGHINARSTFTIPHDVLARSAFQAMAMTRGGLVPERAQRDLLVGTTTAGGHTVATDLLAGSFIDLLRNRSVIAQVGATMLAGLQGQVAIPRQTGAGTFYWVAENNAVTESQQAFDQVTLSPKTGGGFTDMSRQLLMQSSIDVENFVRSDLTKIIGLGIDLAALYGSGSSNQPTGVKATSGINRATFAAPVAAATGPTYAEMVYMESQLATDNADAGSLAYVVRPNMRGYFKTAVKFANTGVTIWEPGNQINGYNAAVSNQVTANDAFFGNWADLLIALWGGLDILVDPYTGAAAGTVRIVALQSCDIGVRHPESFCYGSNQASEG